MLIAATLVAGLLLAQAAQPAPAPAATAAAPAKAEKPKKPRMICEEETTVGSIIARRVCRTPEQVEADRAASRRNTDNMMDHLATCKGASC